MSRYLSLILSLIACICINIESSQSQELEYTDPSNNSYGGSGLVVLPTARFSQDGEFVFGISTESPYSRLYSKVQILPWMEAVLKYTEGTHLPYNKGSPQTWKDKGIDFKIKILDETKSLPALAVGINDFGGTGYFSSEYIVASKRYGNFDFTAGLGWGKLAGLNNIDNPIGWFSDSYKTRGGTSSLGGVLNLNRFFTGEKTSFFSGIEYQTPIPDLSLKLEYDTSDYSDFLGFEEDIRKSGKILDVDSKFNAAVNYQYQVSDRDNLNLSLGFVRGNTVYANFAIHSNLNNSGAPKIRLGAEKLRNINLPGDSFSEYPAKWKNFLKNRTFWELANAGFVTHKIIYNDEELSAEISQGRFLDPIMAFDLASRILANNAPKNITKITVINVDMGIETFRTTIDRAQLTKAVRNGKPLDLLFDYNNRSLITDNAIFEKNKTLYPHFSWSLKPHLNGTLQHQIQFYFYQLEILAHAEYAIKKGLYLSADVGINVTNNFQDYTWHIPDGQLYHVRQDRRLYLTEGESGIRRFAMDYLFEINPNLKGKITAGYLEWMYGGLGSELVYTPEQQNWAIGLDLYWVKQRDFDQRFSFKDYETITGFITHYYDLPFYNLRMKTSVGKFLAKDVGVTFDFSRRFESGSRVGAIVALTDCDSACVGEGSFNKWIYFELPMNLFYTKSVTRSKAGYAWSPLTKDAGTKVEAGGLYGLVVNAKDEVDVVRRPQWSFRKILSGVSTSPKERKVHFNN